MRMMNENLTHASVNMAATGAEKEVHTERTGPSASRPSRLLLPLALAMLSTQLFEVVSLLASRYSIVDA